MASLCCRTRGAIRGACGPEPYRRLQSAAGGLVELQALRGLGNFLR